VISTRAGHLVLTSLRDESRVPVGELPAPVRLLREVFTVAVRRSFADEEPRAITGYVRELLGRRGLPNGGAEAREIEAVMRTVLGEPELAAGIPDPRRVGIMILVVGDLSRAAEAELPTDGAERAGAEWGDGERAGAERGDGERAVRSGGDLLEALVAQAEVRVARFDPPPDGRPWRRRNPR
jgi:hypothetical protein